MLAKLLIKEGLSKMLVDPLSDINLHWKLGQYSLM